MKTYKTRQKSLLNRFSSPTFSPLMVTPQFSLGWHGNESITSLNTALYGFYGNENQNHCSQYVEG